MELYEAKAKKPWSRDHDLTLVSPTFAACLAELMPERYATVEMAHQSLELALSQLQALTIEGVVSRLLSWLENAQSATKDRVMLLFVADEVGAWAGRNLERIEQVRTLVEQFAERGGGRLWLLATSQERLSDVVQNTSALDTRLTREFIQRLEARFGVNVHLESREVGIVIEDRVLRKRPKAVPELETLWTSNSAGLQDIAESPGIELGGAYATPTRERFVKDYPFLPYQLPLAADIFGAMRGVKISNGARSMLKVAFEATKAVADVPIGGLVAWDRIFDAANGENEFADENYLGTPGLASISRADDDLAGKPPLGRPSRLLKILWLIQQGGRIPTTEANLARFLVDQVNVDILALGQQVRETLQALEQLSYVRRDPASSQWRFLTPDEVTVEKIVTRLAGDIAQKQVRDEVHGFYAERLKGILSGRITLGKSNTPFKYGVLLNDAGLVNDESPVSVKVLYANSQTAKKVGEEFAAYLEAPVVYWSVPVPDHIEDRVRRMLAIDALPADSEFNRIRTTRTQTEADRIKNEAKGLRDDAAREVDRALGRGIIYWGGGVVDLEGTSANGAGQQTKAKLEEAIRDRIGVVYNRFKEGDRVFAPSNIEKLLVVPPAQRAGLDPDLGLFDPEGHVHSGQVLPSALVGYLTKAVKTTGQDVTEEFADPVFGWPPDLMRYVAVALFVDGKITFVDKTGYRYDNPKAPAAKAIVGTQAFKSTRLVVEEDPPSPEEISKIRTLLSDLDFKTPDGSELTLADVSASFQTSFAGRLSAVKRAQDAGLPIGPIYGQLEGTLQAIASAGSRANRLRSLLAHGAELRDGDKAISALEVFVKNNGLEQYRRSEQMISLVTLAGLTQDPIWGEPVTGALEGMAALKDQHRVLEEWGGSYQECRSTLIEAFKATYRPLRDEVRAKIEFVRTAILGGKDFAKLPLAAATSVRMLFFGQGRPLEEIPAVPMQSEAELIAASGSFTMSHLRTTLAAIDGQAASARIRIAELLEDGSAPAPASWSSAVLAGKVLTSDAQVDDAFDGVKHDVKALVKKYKSVRIV